MSRWNTSATTLDNLEERLQQKINKTDTCWFWIGSLNNQGYGQIRIQNKCYLAHRTVYEFYKKKIDKSMVLDHLCSMPNCVNPEHLEEVTFIENVRRGKASKKRQDKWKEYCKNGHKFSDNLYMRPDGSGQACKQCRKEATQRYRQNNKRFSRSK